MGDQRRREVERGFDRTPQDPSHRGDDAELGGPQPQDLLEDD
jgi:hypothetical protein